MRWFGREAEVGVKPKDESGMRTGNLQVTYINSFKNEEFN
jgi:hypothetical protein